MEAAPVAVGGEQRSDSFYASLCGRRMCRGHGADLHRLGLVTTGSHNFYDKMLDFRAKWCYSVGREGPHGNASVRKLGGNLTGFKG